MTDHELRISEDDTVPLDARTVRLLRDALAGDPASMASDQARGLLGLTTDCPAVIAVLGLHESCAALGCQR